VIGHLVDQALSRGQASRGSRRRLFPDQYVMQIVFGFLASLVVMAFSRHANFTPMPAVPGWRGAAR